MTVESLAMSTVKLLADQVKQARKLGKCNSYFRNLKLSITHSLTHPQSLDTIQWIGSRRYYRLSIHRQDQLMKFILISFYIFHDHNDDDHHHPLANKT